MSNPATEDHIEEATETLSKGLIFIMTVMIVGLAVVCVLILNEIHAIDARIEWIIDHQGLIIDQLRGAKP